MPLTFAEWPFQPSHKRTIEENNQWWQECYFAGATDAITRGHAHWQIIHGESGSGKSVLIDAIRRRAEPSTLIVEYRPDYWPSGKQAWSKDPTHFAQIMARAMLKLRQDLARAPNAITRLSPNQLIFLRWLITRFDNPRAFTRWCEALPGETQKNLEPVPFDDMYPEQDEWRSVQGQIEDLLNLINALGYSQVLILVEVEQGLAQPAMESAGELFGWLELMQHPGLDALAVMPTTIFESANLFSRSRGRAHILPIQWSRTQVRQIAEKHVQAATAHHISQLTQLIDDQTLNFAEALVLAEKGALKPQYWIDLARVILQVAQTQALPLGEQHYNAIKREFYARCVPLRLDAGTTRHGIWRGATFIELENQPYRLVQLLWRFKGEPVPIETLLHELVCKKKNNVHTIVRRAREKIEPVPANPVYIQGRRDEGYRLATDFDRLM